MKAPADKSPDNRRQAAAHEALQHQGRSDAEIQFIDNRVETTSPRQLQDVANNSLRMLGLAQLKVTMSSSPRSAAMQNLQAMADNCPHLVAQRQLHSRVQSAPVGLQAGSGYAVNSNSESVQRVEDDELLQGEFTAESPVQLAQPLEVKPNNTGLPDNLKAGVESLSGLSLDNVKVHYNCPEPAQLNVHAYAQGTDIHVGPGQEQHLPHEAWHVAQQVQGRVKPTLQMKDGVGVNDDKGLEAEADVMGARAISSGMVQAKQESGGSIENDSIGCADNRPEEIAQRKLQQSLNMNRILTQPVQLMNNDQRPIQRLSYDNSYGDDSWVTWLNSWKEGAEGKWVMLGNVYNEIHAKLILDGVTVNTEWGTQEMLILNATPIGLSEYDAKLRRLYEINKKVDPTYQTDKTDLGVNIAYQNRLFEELEEFEDQTCPMTDGTQITFIGDLGDQTIIKALLCKIYSTSFGKELCDKIIRIIELEDHEKTIEFSAGDTSQAIYDVDGSTVVLDLGDRDYASDEDGKIILNSLEIVTVHELGHLVANLGIDRGDTETAYGALGGADQQKWSDVEEYTNINLVENPHRDSLGVSKRDGHAGDPLIHECHANLRFLVNNHEEWNTLLVLTKSRLNQDLMFTPKEAIEIKEMITLIKKGDTRTTDETASLRWFVRRNNTKIRLMRNLVADGAWGDYDRRLREATALVLETPALAKGQIPTVW